MQHTFHVPFSWYYQYATVWWCVPICRGQLNASHLMYAIIYPADHTKVMAGTTLSPTQQQHFNCVVVRREGAQPLFYQVDCTEICNIVL